MERVDRIYFLGFEKLIKIGTTCRDVKERLRQIELETSMEPISLIGSIEGSYSLENAIHRKLAAHRVKGEWFQDCEEVRDCIKGLLAEGPVHIGFDQSTAAMSKRSREEAAARSPEERAKIFGNLARLIWPETALEELCAFSGAGEDAVSRWLDGSEQPPRLVRFAFGGVVSSFVCPEIGYVTSFLECDAEDFRKLPLPDRSAA
jgi:hypothetical protein